MNQPSLTLLCLLLKSIYNPKEKKDGELTIFTQPNQLRFRHSPKNKEDIR